MLGPRIGLATWLCVALTAAIASAAPPLPQNDGRTHFGATGCKGPVCHTADKEIKNVKGDEWYVWHEDDRHSQAYEVLKNKVSKSIAANLGYKENPWEVGVCLDCHSDHVPRDKAGAQHKLSAGVSCEACHGGSQAYLKPHDSGRPHAQNVADGMYPTDDPIARAALCTSCHYGNKNKFVTHRIMGAGHPRVSFELQVFTNIQPAHFVVDDDYRQRGKKAAEGTVVWAIGQAMSVRAALDALLDPERSRDGTFPELVLFDCYACHHKMSDKKWFPSESTELLGPGRPRLNDSSFLMVRYAFGAVDAAGAEAFAADLRQLHYAASESEEQKRAVATRMRERIEGLIPKLAAWQVDANAVRAVLRPMLADGRSGEFHDYAGAEQASLAAQAMFGNLYSLGAFPKANFDKVLAENKKLLAVVKDPEKYNRAEAVAAFQRLAALLN